MQALLYCRLLARKGYGHIEDIAHRAELDICATFDDAKVTGRWRFDGPAASRIAQIVSLYDWQMHVAPIRAIEAATNELRTVRHA
ncbi:hypothetical protein [Paraburkholderia tropica]|uniref:hypothetical protein n=1 Tax=Paraburkholderia tropica TaxID=92647 RepID=UPI0012EA1A0A|nr:hypothetical protein [Paraburkholderia tropica]